MARRHVTPITHEELARLSTERLLAYRKRLLSLVDSSSDSDLSQEEVETLDGNAIYFKDDPAWGREYGEVKALLAQRENVD
jgi:hypothetical protein